MENVNGQRNNEVLENKKRELLRNFLEPEAFQRMEYLKGSNLDKYNLIVSMVAQSASSGNIRKKITSEQIREIIINLEQRNDRKIEIRRK